MPTPLFGEQNEKINRNLYRDSQHWRRVRKSPLPCQPLRLSGLDFLESFRVCRHCVPRIYSSLYNVLGEARNFTSRIVFLVFKLNRISLKEKNSRKREGEEAAERKQESSCAVPPCYPGCIPGPYLGKWEGKLSSYSWKFILDQPYKYQKMQQPTRCLIPQLSLM